MAWLLPRSDLSCSSGVNIRLNILDYYGRMIFSSRHAALLWACFSSAVIAQTAPASAPQPPTVQAAAPATDAPSAINNSDLDAQTFYEILLGELNVQTGDAGLGFSLMLNAARRAHDPQLYQRAIELALQVRSGEAALQAARAWHQALPQSRAANEALLEILLALNRVKETLEPLKSELSLTPAADRAQAIAQVPRSYLQASDKKLAASVVEQALNEYTGQSATAASAWTAIGRMRLGAGDTGGAMEAARRAQAAENGGIGPALLALELLEHRQPDAEAMVQNYLQDKPLPEMRMGYARVLTQMERYRGAMDQLQLLTKEKPEFVDAWLLMGTLQLQDHQNEAAEQSLRRYVDLANAVLQRGESESSPERSRAMAQAYLALAQIAESRGDYTAAEGWIAKIENAQELVAAQSRRASILAHQGRLDEARALLQKLPEKTHDDIRLKAMAESQLLRDNKQYDAAYEVLSTAIDKVADDPDLLYDKAMLTEKMGRMDEMERLLRQVMTLKPDYHQAYNALGYSLADRNERLPEAQQLIKRALDAEPNDPFIQDSMGWVEFRMGNSAQALSYLEAAYKAQPDVEIAAHLGEVLLSLGQRNRAIAIWREALKVDRHNDTLLETLKRLHVQP